MFACRPAVKLALPFTLGIITGWYFQLAIFPLYCGIMSLALLLFICILRRFRQFIINMLLLVLCFGFGILKISYDAGYKEYNSVGRFQWPESVAVLKGVIADEPVRSGYFLKFVVYAESVKVLERNVGVTGRIIVSWRLDSGNQDDIGLLHSGSRVSIAGRMAGLAPVRNPGEFDYAAFLALNDIDYRFFADSLDTSCRSVQRVSGVNTSLVIPVRKSIVEKIDTLIGGIEARFLRGLLVGDRSDIPADVKDAFVNAGVMHVVAVSGLHVVIVAAMIVIVLQLLRVPERLRFVITGILLVYYALLTGATPSVVRSVIMGVIYLGARFIGRKADVWNILSVSAITILCIDSRQLFYPGFQLSFASVTSIVFLYPRLNDFTRTIRGKNRTMKFISLCWNLFAVSVAAALGTAPFVSAYFGKISLIGILANIIVVPLSNAVLVVGMITVSISYISMPVAAIYAEVTRLLTAVMLENVRIFGNMPFAYIQTGISGLSAIIFYGFVLAAAMMMKKYSRKKALILFLILVNVMVFRDILQGTGKSLRVAFLDVGQGDAIVMELPGGGTIAVDAGPQTLSYNSGERVILPYLRARRISGIDKMIITHPDADHIGGSSALLRGVKIGEVFDGGIRSSALYRRLVDSVKIKRFVAARRLAFSDDPSCRVYVIHPRAGGVTDSVYRNEESVVVRIVYGNTSLLLTGDIDIKSEMELIRIYGSFLGSDILKLGHHGSISSTSAEFIKIVAPDVGVISVGKRNRFNHPSPAVLARLKAAGCSYLRTDEEGAVIFETDGKEWKKIYWR